MVLAIPKSFRMENSGRHADSTHARQPNDHRMRNYRMCAMLNQRDAIGMSPLVGNAADRKLIQGCAIKAVELKH